MQEIVNENESTKINIGRYIHVYSAGNNSFSLNKQKPWLQVAVMLIWHLGKNWKLKMLFVSLFHTYMYMLPKYWHLNSSIFFLLFCFSWLLPYSAFHYLLYMWLHGYFMFFICFSYIPFAPKKPLITYFATDEDHSAVTKTSGSASLFLASVLQKYVLRTPFSWWQKEVELVMHKSSIQNLREFPHPFLA